MTPIHQTKYGKPHGNCYAACVATLLDKPIEDVDVDVASCDNKLKTLITRLEQKANCKIYVVSHEAILHGLVKTTERYCFAEVCSFVFNNDPYCSQSMWHGVVCEIKENGTISLVFNPDANDQRKSLGDFKTVGVLFFVKANSSLKAEVSAP